jgi:hypothetical protein
MVFSVEEISRETIPINWDEGKFDMYRYTDTFMRENGYYAIDYAIKENATSSVWNTQIINNRSQTEYTISPYEKNGGDWLLYVRKYNSIVSKLSLLIADLKAVNTARREKDTAYLDAASRVLY